MQAVNPTAPETSPEAEGNPEQLVSDIQTDLKKLMDLLDKSPAVTPEDKQALTAIMGQYDDFVQNNLSSGPNEGPKPTPDAPGSSPMEAGGNPNAKAMV